MDIMNKMVSMPEMIKKKFDLMAKTYEMDENVEIAKGLKWPEQQLWLIGFEGKCLKLPCMVNIF